jgi:fucose permease
MKTLDKIRHYPRLGLVLLAYVAFIALGMPDGLLGVAWPSIRDSFSIPLDALGSLLIVSTASYITSSALSGHLIARLGIGRVLALSCALTGTALLGYTLVPSWWMMVALGTLGGLGAGAIDAGLNTYVAAHFSEGLMQWLHASYGIGITSGPIIMTVMLGSTGSWRAGYLIVSAVQFFLAGCFLVTLPLWARDGGTALPQAAPRLTDYKTSLGETVRQPRVWLGLALFILYVGAEVGLGTWAYTLLTESRAVDPESAGLWTGSFWAMFTAGRIIAGLFARRAGAARLVMGSLFMALLGALLLWWNPAPGANLAAVAVIGLAIAPVYPGLQSGTERRVGRRFAANTIGMQVAASGLGASVLPALIGILARRTSLEVIPLCLAILFALLLGLCWVGEASLPSDKQQA